MFCLLPTPDLSDDLYNEAEAELRAGSYEAFEHPFPDLPSATLEALSQRERIGDQYSFWE